MAKRCTRCLQWKDSSDFYRDRTKLDGLKSQCKECRKLYKREYRARLRARKRVRLKRVYMQTWLAKPSPPLHLDRRPGFERWRTRNDARRRAYVRAYLRQWHIEHQFASRTWYAHDPHAGTVNRQAARAVRVESPVNTFSAQEWAWLLDAYDHRCAYCGTRSDKLTPDHVVPLSRGGDNTLSNIVPACLKCNQRKGARSLEETDMSFAVSIEVAKHLEQLAFV